MASIPPEALKELSRFDSPTICNVIELCQYRPRSSGSLSHEIRAIYPNLPPMVGYAVTATFRSADPASPQEKPLNLFDQKAAFDAVPAPRVFVIQDLDDPMAGAVYGEIMVHVSRAYGCIALVTNGYARDILQVDSLAFPCFASGTSVSHANCRLLSFGDPVTVGGVTIHPGDLLHGDANGVTTIPHAIAERVANACQPFVDAEEILMTAAKDGRVARGESGAATAEFRRRLDALAETMSGATADHDVGV